MPLFILFSGYYFTPPQKNGGRNKSNKILSDYGFSSCLILSGYDKGNAISNDIAFLSLTMIYIAIYSIVNIYIYNIFKTYEI